MKESWDSKLLQWSGFVVAGFLAVAFIVGGGHIDVSGPRGSEHVVQNAGVKADVPAVPFTKAGG